MPPKTHFRQKKPVVTYREQFTEERAFGHYKGKPLSLSPMYLEKDDHATGLVRLLSLGLRILSLLEYSVRKPLALHNDSLAGLYAGNPKRSTNSPTAEKLLAAFKDIISIDCHSSPRFRYLFLESAFRTSVSYLASPRF